MRSRPSLSLSYVVRGLLGLAVAVTVSGFGCAGVKGKPADTGSGGSGNSGSGGTGNVAMMPSIPGLTGISVSPGNTSVSLAAGSIAGQLAGTASFTATGTFQDGSSKDVTTMVNWTSSPSVGVQIIGGNANVSAPGQYTIQASSGSLSGTGTLTATFTGNFTCSDFDTTGSSCASFNTSSESKLDSGASGSTTIAYPLDGSLFPENLGPIQVHVASPGSVARINFKTSNTSNVNVNYYGACETGTNNPNASANCYVTIPLSLTQLLVPSCETEDITITARVSNGSSAPVESAPINVDWAQAGLTGGLYYWTVVPNQPYCPSSTTANPPNYCLLDTTQTPKNGTAIYRYDFSQTNPAPQQVWTDDGGPNSTPAYQGAPQAWNGGMAGGHCIGCHSITNDGKYMALTIGGSSTYNAANWELLDIKSQTLLLNNPTRTGGNGCSDANATATSDSTCYWEQYRADQFATETAWGPDDTAMVSMYKSKMFLNNVTVSGTSATLQQVKPALPSWTEYQSDPFWSHDGKYLVFTSFNTPATADSIGNPGGLNGDLRKGGQIAIADSDGTTVMDDAKVLVSRANGVTSYYPCVSEDSKFVVFNQSTCGSDPDFNSTAGYGTGTCDGYDDSTAKLWWVPISGGATKRLDNANGSGTYDNSWPRFSPDVGTFRGRTLYWVAYSSRRPYGTQLNNGGLASSQPQLWFAGVVAGEDIAGDPSRAPVWLPGQNPQQSTPSGNHVPQWVKVAIIIDTGSL